MLANLPIVEILPKLVYPKIPIDIQGTHDVPLQYSDRIRVRKLYFSYLFELFSEKDWYYRKLALFASCIIALLGFFNPYTLLMASFAGIQGLSLLVTSGLLPWLIFLGSLIVIWLKPKPREDNRPRRRDWLQFWRYRFRSAYPGRIILTLVTTSLFIRSMLLLSGTGGVIASISFGTVTGMIAAIITFIYVIVRYRRDDRFQNNLSQDDYKEAQAVIFDQELYTPPEATPDDLRDIYRGGIQAACGMPRNSRLSMTDLSYGQVAKQATFTLLHMAALACGVGIFFGAGLILIFALAAIAGISMLLDVSPFYDRMAKRKSDPIKRNEHLFRRNGGLIWGRMMEAKRRKQWADAARDDSPIITLGKTTGMAHDRADPMAPNADMPICISLKDCLTHTIVFGKTGGGKTAAFARPLLDQLRHFDNVGILVMDGKGTLPQEVAPFIDNYKLLDPRNGEPVSLLGDLDAYEVGYLFSSIFGKDMKGGNADFFRKSATTMITYAVALARYAARHNIEAPALELQNADAVPVESDEPIHYSIGTEYTDSEGTVRREISLYDIMDMIEDTNIAFSIARAARAVFREHNGTEEEYKAINYWSITYRQIPADTRGNINTSTQTWFQAMLGHDDLLAWLQATPTQEREYGSVNILSLLRGGRFGLNVPEYRYGDAGKAISNLIKSRIQKEIKKRGDDPDWEAAGGSKVILVVDEVQEIITEKDAEILQVGRSLGYGLFALTQTIENIEHRMQSQNAAKAFLDIFSSVVCFDTLSERTAQFVTGKLNGYMQERIATIPADDPLSDFKVAQQMDNSILVSSSMTANVEAIEPLFDKAVQALAKKLGIAKNRRLNPVLTSDIQSLKFVDANELTGLLGGAEFDGEEYFLALYAINRAGQQRADIGLTKGLFGLDPVEDTGTAA